MKLYLILLLVFTINYSFSAKIGVSVTFNKALNELRKLSGDINFNWDGKLPSKDTIDYYKKLNSTLPPLKNVPVYNDLHGDVYWRGWVKFFHFGKDENLDTENHFYVNPSFEIQHVKNSKYNKRDKNGIFMNVQEKHLFWGKLLANGQMNFLAARKNEDNTLGETVDALNTDLIGHIQPEDNANGAVKDLGSFNEGYCVSIAIKRPENKKNAKFNPRVDPGIEETWIICTDNEKAKDHLMSYLITVKLRRQKELDDVLEDVTIPKSVAEIMKANNVKPKIERFNGMGASGDDGYWIMLQDWSDCSLKCGGGYQLQQWMCVPPKNKGKPCIGNSIRKKVCNIQPCPVVNKNALPIPKPDDNHITLTPIYKALPYSTRPQQYIKCMIKENDVMYKTKEYDPEKKNSVKVPGRIVMNTKTISVFKDETYNNALFTFNLAKTDFHKSADDFCCFFLTSANRQFEICGFNSNCGTAQDPVWVKSWGYDFEFFQKKCDEPLKDDQEPKLDDDAPEPVKNNAGVALDGIPPGRKDLVDGRRAIIEKKIENQTQQDLASKVDNTQKVAMTAIRREINLEDMIKKEEIQKEQKETQALLEEMKQEKKKKDLLEQALVTRDQNYSKMRIEKETKKKIDTIKDSAKVDIKFKRDALKRKLQDIRNKFKRRRRQIQQQIHLIRAEIADKIVNANKHGDMEKCKAARKDIEKIKDYCDTTFADNLNSNQSCKELESFCYTCCEAEFGNMYMSERDDCNNMCDEEEKKELNTGDWVWVVDSPTTQNAAPPAPQNPPPTH